MKHANCKAALLELLDDPEVMAKVRTVSVSQRAYFAAMAMQTFALGHSPRAAAEAAVKYADALIEALEAAQ